MVGRAVRPVFDKLASSLKEVAAALEDSDLEKAEEALSQARGIDEQLFFGAMCERANRTSLGSEEKP
jgi:flagellin-specific chaperone FliS